MCSLDLIHRLILPLEMECERKTGGAKEGGGGGAVHRALAVTAFACFDAHGAETL